MAAVLSLALRKQSVRISLGHSLSLLMVLLAHKYHVFTFKLGTTPSLQLCSNPALIILTPSYHLNPHKLAAKILIFSKMSTSKIIAKFNHTMSASKGKAVSLQACNGPEGSRKLRFPDFMTTAQDGGKVVSLTHRPTLPPGKILGTHFC